MMRDKPGPDVSIVVPVFDEQDNVGPLYGQIVDAMDATARTFEVVIIDDGSTDQTVSRLRALSQADPRLRVVRLSRNFGQSTAIQAGFDHSSGAKVITLDGDLQNDPADIPRLLDELEGGYDLIAGWRKNRKDGAATRLLPSRVANILIARLIGIKIHDNGCTLRAYRRELIDKTRIYADLHRFMVPMLSVSGARYKEVEVHHRPRTSGKSKYGLSRIWKVLLDMLSIKLLVRFAAHPAAWFAVLSFPLFVFSIVTGIVSLATISGETTADGISVVSSSISLITLFAALNLFFYGFFAEIVVRHGDYSEADALLKQVERKD